MRNYSILYMYYSRCVGATGDIIVFILNIVHFLDKHRDMNSNINCERLELLGLLFY